MRGKNGRTCHKPVTAAVFSVHIEGMENTESNYGIEARLIQDIADEISGVTVGSGYYSTDIGSDAAREAAELAMKIVHPVITSETDLDSLPIASVIRDARNVVAERSHAGWCTIGGEIWQARAFTGPVTVLLTAQ